MWTPILLQNRENVLRVMDTYTDKLDAFRKAMEDADEDALRELIQDANRIRRIIR
jgi:prephenate dehydrogenase